MHEGYISWAPGGSFKSKCDIAVQLYPFDVQTCMLKFENWMYANSQVKLAVAPWAGTTLEKCCHSGEWEVSELPANTVLKNMEDETFNSVSFGLKFERKPTYYIINVVAPTLCLSLLVLLVMRLPAESGEKISMGVTLLLSFAVYMLLVSDSVPTTSDAVPVLGKGRVL